MKIEKKFVFAKEDGEAVDAVLTLLGTLIEDGGVHHIVSNIPGETTPTNTSLDDLWSMLIDFRACIETQGAALYLFKEE